MLILKQFCYRGIFFVSIWISIQLYHYARPNLHIRFYFALLSDEILHQQ